MELQMFIAFVLATSIMIALPGPSVLLTVAHSISFGWQRAIATVAGATVGIAVQLVVAAIGLASLLNGLAAAFEWLRWGGAAYLVYLGIKQWQSAGEPVRVNHPSATKTNLFFQGVVVTVFNPKSLIFIAAFLPQFIDISRPADVQFFIIMPVFLLITFSVTSVWAVIAAKISGVFQSRCRVRSLFRTAGALMVISGLGLAMARRGN
jgi:threonine/homoserine/homoserine lactone efflux protein